MDDAAVSASSKAEQKVGVIEKEEQLLTPNDPAGNKEVQQPSLEASAVSDIQRDKDKRRPKKASGQSGIEEKKKQTDSTDGGDDGGGEDGHGDEESSGDESDGDFAWARFGRYFKTDLEERRVKSERRLMQSTAYAGLVEDRIVELEKNIGILLKIPEESRGELSAKPPVNRLEIIPMDWLDFGARYEVDHTAGKTWKHIPEIDSSPRSVIEILQEEPRYDYRLMTERKANNPAQEATETPTDSHDTTPGQRLDCDVHHEQSSTSGRKTDSPMPYRIRIRSPLLLSLIKDITGFSTVIGPHKHRLVFFRPFKLLVSVGDDLRKHLKRMENTTPKENPEPMGTQTGLGQPKLMDSEEARNHLRLLCDVLDKYLQPKIAMRISLDPSIQQVSFDDLWYLFKPGDEVRTPGKDQIQLYRIMKVTGGREVLSPHRDAPGVSAAIKLKNKGFSLGSFIIECFYIHFDGFQYGPVNETFMIRKFEGRRNISSLPVTPFDCDPKRSDVRERLLIRGNKFARLARKPAHRKYKGLSLGERKEQVESQVIIDFQLAFIESPKSKPDIGLDGLVDDDARELHDPWRACSACREEGCCGNDISHDDYEVDEKDRSAFKSKHKFIFDTTDLVEQLSDDQKVLLPFQVYGFILRSRRWDIFDIDLLDEVDYDSASGWRNLVIDEGIKETVLALVQNHERPQDSQERVDGALSSVDLVQGKGKGLIILLHGEPGVGKTSTAECVADHTHRPLFPITCGDIGETAKTVENSLEKNFQLAHKWGCVLLLDEADIFLSKRTNADVARNAIVSVFLRSLEYYSGILFLTTNRVGVIDRAFKSRIHLTLYYPRLDRKRTAQIWENNLALLDQEFKKDKKAEGQEIKLDKESIMGFSKKHFKKLKKEGLPPWNGRQIRNAFQTAVAIANYESKSANPPQSVTLGAGQFSKVAESAIEFDKFLRDLSKGKTDAELAQEAALRIDDWEGFKLVREQPVPIRRSGDKRRRRRRSTSQETQSDSDSSSDPDSDSDSDKGGSSRRRGRASSEESDQKPAKKRKKRSAK